MVEIKVSATKQTQGWEAAPLACRVFLPEVDGSLVKADVRHPHDPKEATYQGWRCSHSFVVLLVHTGPAVGSTAQTPTGEGYAISVYLSPL